MKQLAWLAVAAALSTPARCADLLFTNSKHVDAFQVRGREVPARDTTEIAWMGKERMRIEEGERVVIVRIDRKKLYVLDTKAKTYSALDLPIDPMKYVPAETAPKLERIFSKPKIEVTPTGEKKEIRGRSATRYTIRIILPTGSAVRHLWTTKDIAFDQVEYYQLMTAVMSLAPAGTAVAAELSKIEGFPVLMEGMNFSMGTVMKRSEELTSVERKDPPEGTYEVPDGFEEVPYDLMSEMGKAFGAVPKER